MKYMLIFLFVFVSSTNFAQTETPDLITDRPDQTESSSVVPFRSLQIETGFILGNKTTAGVINRSYDYNTTLLRYGLFENFELRLGLAYQQVRFINKTSGEEIAHNTPGLSPLYTGFKVKVNDENGWVPEIAFLGAMVLPFTSQKDYRPSNAAANMRFAFSHTLSENISIGYNLGAEWDGESPIPGYFYSVALGFGLSDKLGMFVESYGLLVEAGNSEHLVDAGFTYALRPNFQLDISGGFGLNDVAIDNFISCGLSWRIPK